MGLYIITPCSRIEHLSKISKTIPNDCIWVIVYDSNNHEVLSYGDIIFRPKNITGSYGKPHINYALDNLNLTNSDWIYVLDDDNLIHPNWYENVKPYCNNDYNILSWGQLWNDNSMRLRPTKHMMFRAMDQASYMWRYGFKPTIRFNEDYFGDGTFAEKLGENSHMINKYISYYNYFSLEYFTTEEKLKFDNDVLSYLSSQNIHI